MSYKSIHKLGRDEVIINKSRFIGTASPVTNEEEALEFIEKIKKEYKDASHNVYAYTIGESGNLQRFSDDGEPSGTAGMPVLNVINQENLRNVVVVVTRYFGGVMLGAGGLVRAYTKGAKIGLDNGLIVEKSLFNEVSIKTEYTLLGKMENELSKNSFIIKDKVYEENVILTVLCKVEDMDRLTDLINEVTSGNSDFNIGQSSYYSINDGKIVV
ncbi:MAG: YigZ family protein [Tissierellia bacterium]|nr:YigZ family protein [Tissierellia bacterium]MDD4780259.1 YigZ family protein [Tissierellia bacterium]